QHAFGEKPVPDADQEYDRGPVSPQLVFHHHARPGCGRRLPDSRAYVAQGVRLSRQKLAPRPRKTPRNYAPPPGEGRLYGQLVLLSARRTPRDASHGSRSCQSPLGTWVKFAIVGTRG